MLASCFISVVEWPLLWQICLSQWIREQQTEVQRDDFLG
jgi:hypothetical protein